MNYYNYFTEIEEHFWRRRGAQIYLSPVDWALIASWQESGIPLEAVLAGIDQSFEKWASGRRRDSQRPRALVYCAPAVLAAAEARAAAAVGAGGEAAAARADAAGFSRERIVRHLDDARARIAASAPLAGAAGVAEILDGLAELRAKSAAPGESPDLEAIERWLTVLDEKLLALLRLCIPVAAQVDIRAEVDRELASCRRRLRAEQLQTIERQFLQRRMLEAAGVPRLSLFFMPK